MNNFEEENFQPITPSESFRESIIPEYKKKRERKKVKKERKPISLSKPIMMSLLTLLVMVLSLLSPLTIALAKATASLSGSTEKLIRRLGGDKGEVTNGNETKSISQGTKKNGEKQISEQKK